MEIHVERGKIRAVLPSPMEVLIRTERETFSFPGACVVPGFVDSHVHLLGVGQSASIPSLHSATNVSDCIRMLQQATPVHGWIQARGWNENNWDNPRLPDATDLDAAFPDVPVICYRADGHAAWVNSCALRYSGYSHASGLLVDSDVEHVTRVIPGPDRTEIEQWLIKGSELFAAAGVTEVHDMDIAPDVVGITRELGEQGKLAVRVQSFVSAQHFEFYHHGLLPAGGEIQRTFGVKMFADGALGSRGAALLQPYSDRPDTSGTLLLTSNDIYKRTMQAIDDGWWSVAVHAIGDRAVREVLNAFEQVRNTAGTPDTVLRIEHAQTVAPDDVRRFADLNVIASVQPVHAVSDAAMATDKLGTDRLRTAYRLRSFLDNGIKVITGTDAPVESVSALQTLDACMTRTHAAGLANDECISADDAMRSAGVWAHSAAHVDHRRGTLAVGMDADFTVLDRPLVVTTSNADNVHVLATFMAGQPRYLP